MVKREKAEKTKFNTWIRIAIMTVICVLSIAYVLYLFLVLEINRKEPVVLNYGWNLTFNGETYQGVDLRSFSFGEVKRGDVAELVCTIPDNIPQNCILVVPHGSIELVDALPATVGTGNKMTKISASAQGQPGVLLYPHGQYDDRDYKAWYMQR